MRIISIFVLLLVLPFYSWSQIRGTFVQDGYPYPMVKIYFENSSGKASSNFDGEFKLKIPKDSIPKNIFIYYNSITLQINNCPLLDGESLDLGTVILPKYQQITTEQYQLLKRKERKECLPLYDGNTIVGYLNKTQLDSNLRLLKCEKKEDISNLVFNSKTNTFSVDWINFIECLETVNENNPQIKDEINDLNTNTLESKNTNDSSYNTYAQNAIKILPDGTILEGITQIEKYHLNAEKIRSKKVDTIITAQPDKGIAYEVTESIFENNEKFKSIAISQMQNNQSVIVFEFTSRLENTLPELSEIDKRRAQWIALCNKHNAADLINEVYTEDNLYYNHKPLVKGRYKLLQEYQYMNNPKYQLSLQPIFISPVNDRFTFEIGQCLGSYNGKYIIVWRKDQDGQWRVFIDSNI